MGKKGGNCRAVECENPGGGELMTTNGLSEITTQQRALSTVSLEPAQATAEGEGVLTGAARSFRDALARVERSERFVDRATFRVSRGDDLSAGELLALQAQVYRASQHAELLSRAVDRVSDTVREITQIKV